MTVVEDSVQRTDMPVVGRVVALWRYPVKSMAGQSLTEVEVSWHGLEGDRRWAFIRPGKVESGFPWLTIRERPEMSLYAAFFTDPDRPDGSPTVVRTPTGHEYGVGDPDLAAELGDGVGVIKQERGVFDAMPLSVTTTQSLSSLADMSGVELDARRFRPNVVIDGVDGTPFPEDEWVGRILRMGGVRMRVDQRDNRCVMVNVDPVTTIREPRVLRAIAQERQACFGVYGSTVEPGRMTVGDEVLLEPTV